MHPEKYCLTWDTYSEHLKDMMKEMMNDDFTDVTIVSEDRKHIRAHKNILSASSSVFKDIMKFEQGAKPIIYLKGIKFPELESIIQFIYLGEAKFCKDRIKEFLDLAKYLDIKELCKPEIRTNDVDSDSVPSADNSGEQTVHLMNQIPKDYMDRKEVVRLKDKYECDQCHKIYASGGALFNHRQSAHDGIKYACDQCDYKITDKGNLKRHIESKHEGVRHDTSSLHKN